MKLARMLSAIGVMAALAGCRTCWIDRDDDRPMKYGSARDCLSYGWWGECFHPLYHCGPPDGIRDHLAVKKAAVKAANRALSDQDCGETSRDFKYGFQQAYIDISNGGSGVLPAVPPPRYWTAAYRTTWGHNKARDWFSGYQAGASTAKCCMPADTLSVPTSVSRDGANRLAMDLDGGSFGAAPIVNANYGWPGGGATYSTSPMLGSPYSTMPNSAGPYSMGPYQGAMNAPTMNGQPPMMPSPAMNAPYSQSFPGGPPSAESNGPSPALPNYSVPNYSVPNYSVPNYSVPNSAIPGPSSGGSSIPNPGSEIVNPPRTPMNGQSFAPFAAPQRGFSASNLWGRFSGMSGFGFKPEGASR